MNKIIFLLPVLLFSCNMMRDIDGYLMAKDHNLTYNSEWQELESYRDIYLWINSNIDYKSEEVDSWDDPQIVLDRGYGDCDDWAILFMNIAYYALDIKMDLIIVESDSMSRAVVSGGNTNLHAMVYYDGHIIEPSNGLEYYGPIGYIYSFDEVFR